MEDAYLQVKDGKGERQVALYSGPTTIGRNFTNLLVLHETQASRFHCVIEKASDGIHLRDLKSRNGTLLNGAAVSEAVLKNGDVVKIGTSELKVVIPVSKSGKSSKQATEDAVSELAQLVNEEMGIDQDEEEEEYIAPSAAIPAANEFERALRERADSLVDRTFGETEITLVNARGKVAIGGVVDGNRVKEAGEAISLLRLILLICFRSRATDIHIEPKSDDVPVRIRVDGVLIDVIRMSKDLGLKLLSAVKVLSDIDIAQRNIVQEGHFSARVPTKSAKGEAERRVDYRVSFAPAMHGQKLVVRVLDSSNAPLHIDDLQLPRKAREIIRRTSEQESGMILVCGPTGSGKTTTLYAILRDIDVNQRNVVTIEDPVEIQLEGITQIPVNEGQGNTFSALLRSILRQDPDVLLVGEIRDQETARVAVQAGMTGHLVFSTVHARDAISGMFRLLDLGVEPYVVASGLHVVVAQRLVRQLCPHCKTPSTPNPDLAKRLAANGFPNVKQVFLPKGCRRCLGTGHFGRRAMYEVLMATPALRDTMLKKPTIQECLATLNPDSFVSLTESGYRLVAEGVACMEEVEKAIV